MYLEIAIRSSRSNGAAFNALKHGCYADSIVPPGEDAEQFRRERLALFHNYSPQSHDKADLVDAMAEHRWVSRRFQSVQIWFDGQAVPPQKLPRGGQIAGAVALPQDCHMETDGRVSGPVVPQAIVPIPEPDVENAAAELNQPPRGNDLPASSDGENGKNQEQPKTEHGGIAGVDPDPSAPVAPGHAASGRRWTGTFGAPGEFAKAPGTAMAGV